MRLFIIVQFFQVILRGLGVAKSELGVRALELLVVKLMLQEFIARIRDFALKVQCTHVSPPIFLHSLLSSYCSGNWSWRKVLQETIGSSSASLAVRISGSPAGRPCCSAPYASGRTQPRLSHLIAHLPASVQPCRLILLRGS
jgi:hypothetical protein